MPRLDFRNLLRDHSPYRFPEMHRRTFGRFVGAARLQRPEAPPFWVGVTRLRDRQGVFFDARRVEDPLALCLASNYVPPFYTHAPRIAGERYGDGGLSDNIPYEKAFARGVRRRGGGDHERGERGGALRTPGDPDHVIPAPWAERTVVIRHRHRLPCAWVESRWEMLRSTIDLGRLRAREVLLAESHPETEVRARPAPSTCSSGA